MAQSWQSNKFLKNFVTIREVLRYGARYYDPTLQRFISEDPIGFSSGDFNWYRYVLRNPVSGVDPSGLHKLDKLYGLGKDFWKWFHKYNNGKDIKDLKGPNRQVPKEDAEAYYEYWKQLGKPKPDKKRNWKDDLLDLLIPLPIQITCELNPCNPYCETWGYTCNLDTECKKLMF